jgi:ABC-type branched-subunit amino acid transport system substrate-binding protein
MLRPLVGRTVDPEETALVLGTLAAAEQAIGDRLSALTTRDRELAGELPQERRKQVEIIVRDLVAALDPALELPRAYETLPRSGFAWPEVARRLLRVSHERGERDKVTEIADDLRDGEHELDEELAALVLKAERPSDANPGLIGAILPLSGRGREVGEAALQGLLLASDLEAGSHPRLVYRDDAGDAERAVEALEDLVSVHRVIAVIGPLSAGPAQAVADRAEDLEVPIIALSPDPSLTQRAETVFRMLPEPREEASVLVRRAARAGAKSFALLRPEGAFGQIMLQAFQQAVRAENGSLTDVAYPTSTTNFVREAEQVARLGPHAVILADAPARVTLIAPALAAAGVWSVAAGERPPEGRAAQYLVPSAGFDPTLARTSRRYLQGALFAVSFDAQSSIDFADAYRARYRSEPNLFSAAAYDAYRLVEAALQTGAQTRDQLTRSLSQSHAEGNVTAVGGFSPARGPHPPVRLHTLLGDAFVRE